MSYNIILLSAFISMSCSVTNTLVGHAFDKHLNRRNISTLEAGKWYKIKLGPNRKIVIRFQSISADNMKLLYENGKSKLDSVYIGTIESIEKTHFPIFTTIGLTTGIVIDVRLLIYSIIFISFISGRN